MLFPSGGANNSGQRCRFPVTPECPFRGAFEEMKSHLERDHGAVGAFYCDRCDYRSNFKALLNKHQKTHLSTKTK